MKRLLTLLTLILSFTLVKGQELTVKNFALAPQDLTASTQRRDDNNGQACALIKVQLARPGATFHGNVMGDTPYSQSVYMVYMMKGSKMLEVRLDGYLPVMIDFEKDWGINGVESLTTYILSITLPNLGAQTVDDGMSYFTLTVTPKNASVLLDGELMSLDSDGSLSKRLPRGRHSYRVAANGYVAKEESFVLGATKYDASVTLVSAKAKLTVTCATTEADIYINEEKKGRTSWNGTLDPGNYLIEARKEGFITQQKSITLSDNQNIQVDFQALVARTGQLDIDYKPINAEVWIDGKKAGTAPDLFKNLTLGDHKVEIRKEGYQSETKTVTIAEGQTATLSGSLTALTSSSSTMSISSTVSASSSTSTSTVSSTTQGKQTFTVNGVSFTMIRVEGGTFTMGATKEQGSDAGDDEKPAHKVALSSFSIGETEVTQELWEAVMGSNPSYFKSSKRPVEQVSWDDCQEFINKLNDKTGKEFRLPTEAEWEYAARGGHRSQKYKYNGSNSIGDVAWYIDNSGSTTHDVATKLSNELGLYDMSGNVWEWCSDWYGKYIEKKQKNPKGLQSGQARVGRGGCWGYSAWRCRPSYRNGFDPGGRYYILGFRLAFSE